MTPHPRTPQQRDRRFARVRRLTQTILIGSGLASGLFIGYAKATAKPLTTVPAPVTAVTTPPSSSSNTPSSGGTGSNAVSTPSASSTHTAPAPAPVTTTTVCYSTPSGTTVCN